MNCRIISLSVLLLFAVAASAQRDERTAGQPLSRPGDTVKVSLLNSKILVLRETDPSSALKLCFETIALAKALNDQKGLGRATGNLGWIYFRQGDYVKALNSSIEAIKISERIGDALETARCLNNLAAIYNEEHQFKLSLNSLEKAREIAERIGDAKTLARSLNNTALLYLEAWNVLDSAEAYATLGLKLSDKTNDDYNGSFSNRILGDVLARRGEPAKALKYYFRSLNADASSTALTVETWNHVAEAYISRNSLSQATPVLLKNIETTRKYGYREELAKSYQLLSRVYKMQGNLEGAFSYLRRYSDLYDSIYNDQSRRQLATLQNQSELDLKQAQIELLLKDTQLNKKTISEKQVQVYAMIGGLAGFLIIAVLLFYLNRKISYANLLLEKQKEELALKNREVESKSHELESQASELSMLNATKDKLFSIIGHDFRSPLNSLKGILALLENRDLSREQFTSMAGVLKSNLDSVSTTLENLLQWSLAQTQGIQTKPVRLHIHTLVDEHVVLFNELAKAKNIRLENDIAKELFAYYDENQLRLVLRNLINNAIKFSGPGGVVRISNQSELPFIKILVSDTGIGIEPAQLRSFFTREKVLSREGTNQEKGMGIGLLLCQEFVENNGGRLTVASEPGKGSVFAFTLKAA